MGARDSGCIQHIPWDGWRRLHWAVGLGQEGHALGECSGKREGAGFCAGFVLSMGNQLQSVWFLIPPNLSVRSGMLESSSRNKWKKALC